MKVVRPWAVLDYATDPLLIAVVRGGSDSLSYRLYLRTQWWKYRRRQALLADKETCQICGSTVGLQIHHLTYLNLWHEEAMDLTALCETCHRRETAQQGYRLYAPRSIPIPPNIVRYLRS